jgi:hypothetical protein
MPSASDFFNELQGANIRLEQVKTELLQLKASLDSLVLLDGYADDALSQNAKQNDTIICILEHISRNTCALLNESVVQTRLQTSIEASARAMAAITAASHSEAALAYESQEKLRKQLEECCPPPAHEPPCRYEKCKAPGALREPPKVEQPPQIERPAGRHR